MKKFMLSFLPLLAVLNIGFAGNLVLDNQTTYPNKESKLTVQWASSLKDVEEENRAVVHGSKLNSSTLKTISRSGKIDLSIPKNAEYFRVLVWSKGEEGPEFLTNWVDVVPNKTYRLQTDHLVPSVLILGAGC